MNTIQIYRYFTKSLKSRQNDTLMTLEMYIMCATV